MTERSADFKRYVAYFCHANVDTKWVMDMINTLESKKYGIKCAEYDRDFSCCGKYITDLFQEFLEDSHWIIVVLSPEFVRSKWSMYQLNLAVHYSVHKKHSNIVPLLKTPVDVPDCLKCFELVDTREKKWLTQLLLRLSLPAAMFPKFKPVCTNKDHISMDALAGPSTRNIMSEQFHLQRNDTLSQEEFNKVKILKYMHEGQSFWNKARREGFPKSGPSAICNNRHSSDRKGEEYGRKNKKGSADEGVTYTNDDPDAIPDCVLDSGNNSKGHRLHNGIGDQRTYAIPDCVLDSGNHSKGHRLQNGVRDQRTYAIPDCVLGSGNNSKGHRLQNGVRDQRTYAIPDCVLDSGNHSKGLRFHNGIGKQRIDADCLLLSQHE
ncbi:uncharacterized protein LOC124288101 [Haliotis rubra]|uniref:uncharacterized protein LOC124288101 n=1 Tax=Haliotis rubra TaxID=36100 RepID=UPI001EE5AF79|nr:uncharacterized protein LOC124288101 [Haliotis rubra]